MAKQRKPEYINSPDYREAARSLMGWLIVTAVFFAVFVATLIFTVEG